MKNYFKYMPLVFLCGCAGLARDCSSCNAESFGSQWIIVQYGFDGTPINCWQEMNAAVSNESGTDGIYWKHGPHLVHISGFYSRVQVANNDFSSAANAIGIDLARCSGGIYKK